MRYFRSASVVAFLVFATAHLRVAFLMGCPAFGTECPAPEHACVGRMDLKHTRIHNIIILQSTFCVSVHVLDYITLNRDDDDRH